VYDEYIFGKSVLSPSKIFGNSILVLFFDLILSYLNFEELFIERIIIGVFRLPFIKIILVLVDAASSFCAFICSYCNCLSDNPVEKYAGNQQYLASTRLRSASCFLSAAQMSFWASCSALILLSIEAMLEGLYCESIIALKPNLLI
jgi:hypothetical protein